MFNCDKEFEQLYYSADGQIPVAEVTAVTSRHPEMSGVDSEAGRTVSLTGVFVVLVLLSEFHMDYQRLRTNRPSMKEIMQKAHEKNR